MLRKMLSLLLMLCLVPVQAPGAAMAAGSGAFEEVQLLKGDFYSIPTKGLQKVSLTDPNIADINDAKPDQVVLMGQQPGQTVLFIWDNSGKRTIIVRVLAEDLELIKARIRGLLDNAQVEGVVAEVNNLEGKVLLTGTVPADKKEGLNTAIEQFSGNVINMIKIEENEDLIQIDMQITELSTTLSKALGVDWTTGTTAGVGAFLFQENGVNQPSVTGRQMDAFKIGDFNRSSGLLTAKINALVSEGKGHVLSKPRLVVKNGKEATFIVGGEIPIKSVTTNAAGGTATENTTFKSYGVSLAITPTIKEEKVDVTLTIEISDVDGKQLGSDTAFLTRSAQTQLYLNDRQTIVMAGMIKRRKDRVVHRIPILGSIPVVGWLFKSEASPTQDEDTEVVISMTPTIIKSAKKKSTFPESAPAASVVLPSPALGTLKSMGEASARNNQKLPVITKNVAEIPVTIAPELKPYAQQVQQKISSAIAYPYEAQENGWQGTVKLGLVIRRDGSLRDVFVKEGSGYDVFDQDAANTAQILAPYAPFPDGMAQEEVTITLPIVYNLDVFLKNVAKRK